MHATQVPLVKGFVTFSDKVNGTLFGPIVTPERGNSARIPLQTPPERPEMPSWLTKQKLKSRRAETRRQAVETLAAGGGSKILPSLAQAVVDVDPNVRIAAIRALARTGEQEAMGQLIRALRDPKPEVREAAVLALQQHGDRQAVEALADSLGDQDGGVRWRAAKALESFGWHASDDEHKLQYALAVGNFSSAAALGTDAVEPLMNIFKDREFSKRRAVLEALAKTGDTRVVKVLISALKDSDPQIRVTAAELFVEIPDAQGVDPLSKCLRDNADVVRAAAATALGKLRDVRAVEHLIRALGDRNWAVRKASVEALGILQDPTGLEPIAGLLKDPDTDVREAAVLALGQLRNARAVEWLVVSLADPQTTVRSAAGAALQRIDEQWLRSEGAQRAIPALESAMRHKDYWVRHSASAVCESIRNAHVLGPVVRASPDTEAQLRRGAALDAFIEVLCDPDRDLRLAAAEALGRIGDERSVQPLLDSLADDDPWVRSAVSAALAALGGRQALTANVR
jgi:HEAT repeat protein